MPSSVSAALLRCCTRYRQIAQPGHWWICSGPQKPDYHSVYKWSAITACRDNGL